MNKIKKQLECLVGASVEPIDGKELQREVDLTAKMVSDFLADLKQTAEDFQDVLNDVSSELEEFVMDEQSQRLLYRLDKVIDWLYDLQKED